MQPSQQMCSNCARRLAVVVAQPGAGVAHDVELAVGIVGQAVAAGLVVRAGAFDGAVVLRDVEVDRPRAQRARSSWRRPRRALSRSVQSKSSGQEAIFGRVVAQREEQRVRHVGLEAERLRAGRPSRAARHMRSSYACRPSRSRLRRPAARRSPRRCRRPRGRSRRSAWCCPPGSFAHSDGLAAESMRTMP